MESRSAVGWPNDGRSAFNVLVGVSLERLVSTYTSASLCAAFPKGFGNNLVSLSSASSVAHMHQMNVNVAIQFKLTSHPCSQENQEIRLIGWQWAC